MNRRIMILAASLAAIVAVVALLGAFRNALAAAPQAPAQPAAQPVPAAISYQGRLDDGGNRANGFYTMTFSIYDVYTGGIPLWTQTSAVAVSDGLFDVMLGGPSNPLDSDVFSGGSRWLGVQVDPDPEMEPRQPVNSVPYAMTAETLRVGSRISGTYPSSLLRLVNNGTGPALTTGGGVHVGGDLSWDTRIGYISVSPAAFEPYSMTYHYIKKGRSLYARDGEHYYAPLQLPHSATIASMVFYYRDTTVTPGAVTMTLKRGSVDGTDDADMAQVGSQNMPGDGYGSGTTTTVTNPVVDSENYIYWLYGRFAGTLDDNRAIMAVVIEYRYNEPY